MYLVSEIKGSDKSRVYLKLQCSICNEYYIQQKRLFEKSLYKNRCKKHRSKYLTVDEKKGKTNKCLDCKVPVFRGHERCKPCSEKFRTLPRPLCSSCNKQIKLHSITCRSCHNKNQDKGLSRLRTKFNASRKWNIIRGKCFERDKYQCKICLKIGGYLHAHHIKFYSKHPELKLDINNLLTLCRGCHFEYHSAIKQSKKNNITL